MWEACKFMIDAEESWSNSLIFKCFHSLKPVPGFFEVNFCCFILSVILSQSELKPWISPFYVGGIDLGFMCLSRLLTLCAHQTKLYVFKWR